MRALVLLAAATLGLAGCGLLTGAVPGTGFSGGASCADMPGGACQEQIELAGRRHAGATQVDVACTVGPCTRARGAGTVVVTLANGAKVTETFSYVGDPAPVPAPVCTGLPLDVCRQAAEASVAETPPSKRISGIAVTCTALPCTRERGDTAIEIKFADGSATSSGYGWAGQP